MKAILTKFYGATATMPARIKAYDMDGNKTWVSWDEANSQTAGSFYSADERAHRYAAMQLFYGMGWNGTLIAGAIKGGYAFVFVEGENYWETITKTDWD